jgi:hypothetical protein
MVDSHSKSFFGQNTGIIIKSPSRSVENIFITCIKKKNNGNWEKPTLNEGKTIKISLEEIVMILEVLKRNSESWKSYHSFENEKTPISFNWDGKDKSILWINIGEYKKRLSFSQIFIFKMFMAHLLKEKIEYSTTAKTNFNSE